MDYVELQRLLVDAKTLDEFLLSFDLKDEARADLFGKWRKNAEADFERLKGRY